MSPSPGGAGGRPSPLARVLLAPIRGYRRWISPYLPPTCRFHPTCSTYAVEALTVHGAVRGAWLTVRRLSRCGPWHPGGLDPVPPRGPQRDDGAERAPSESAGGAGWSPHTPAEE